MQCWNRGRGRRVGCLGIDEAGIYPNAEFLRVKSHFGFFVLELSSLLLMFRADNTTTKELHVPIYIYFYQTSRPLLQFLESLFTKRQRLKCRRHDELRSNQAGQCA